MRRLAVVLATAGLSASLVGAAGAGTASAAATHPWKLDPPKGGGASAHGKYAAPGKRGFTATLNLRKTQKNDYYLVFWHRHGEVVKGKVKWGRPGVEWTKKRDVTRHSVFRAPENDLFQSQLCWASKIKKTKRGVQIKYVECGGRRTVKVRH